MTDEELYRLRCEFIAESSAAYDDCDPDEVAALLAEVRTDADRVSLITGLSCDRIEELGGID